MMKLLNDKLDQLGAKKFRFLGPIICLISDIILILYLNKVMLKNLITDQLVINMALIKGISSTQLSQGYIQMIKEVMLSSLSLAFWCILIYNIIIYALCMKNINWSKKYVKGYAFSAVFLSVFEIIGVFLKTSQINIITIATMILYFLVYYGYKYFMKKEEL